MALIWIWGKNANLFILLFQSKLLDMAPLGKYSEQTCDLRINFENVKLMKAISQNITFISTFPVRYQFFLYIHSENSYLDFINHFC